MRNSIHSTYEVFIEGNKIENGDKPAVINSVLVSPSQELPVKPVQPKPVQSVCESRPLDLAVLIDSSRSISMEDFEVEKNSVQTLIDNLHPINEANTRVSRESQIGTYYKNAHRIHRLA